VSLYLIGFAIVAALFAVSLFIISASPTLVGLAYRCLGVVLGIHLMTWIAGGGLARAEPWLLRLAPLTAIPYVIAALGVKGLLDDDWLTTEAALAQYDWRGLAPAGTCISAPRRKRCAA
jgi:hypothetical protein